MIPDNHVQRLGAELRATGVAVGPSELADFAGACEILGPLGVYWAGRVTLVRRCEDIRRYDDAFLRVWGDAQPAARPLAAVDVAPSHAGDATGRVDVEAHSASAASALELLREKPFDRLDDDELAELLPQLRRIVGALPVRRTRRTRPGHDGRIDMRRTVARALRADDDRRPVRSMRRVRPRDLVLILDVSRSMAGYSRALLHLGHAAVTSGVRCEVFCFATRLSRITRQLAEPEPARALADAGRSVSDWDGGTRIGESLKHFLDEYGHAGTARGAVIIIYSDGFETGEPELLAAQMDRLRRLAHSIVWLNPLKAQPGYEPLTLGMAAALPYTSTFRAGHNLASLEALAEEWMARGAESPVPTRRAP